MNSVNLGANTLGVQAASKKYFNKDVSELTLSEASVIAGITQNPSGYNPITHPDKNAKRREKVLNNMKDQGYISKAQYDEAMADDVYSRIAEYNTTGSGSVNTYFIDALIDNVFDDLTAAGYSETEAYKLIYKGGLTIKSTQDLTMQTICDEEANNPSNYPSDAKYSFQLSFEVKRQTVHTRPTRTKPCSLFIRRKPTMMISASTTQALMNAMQLLHSTSRMYLRRAIQLWRVLKLSISRWSRRLP